MNGAQDKPVRLQLAQRLREHLLRGFRDVAAQLTEAQFAVLQKVKRERLPATTHGQCGGRDRAGLQGIWKRLLHVTMVSKRCLIDK